MELIVTKNPQSSAIQIEPADGVGAYVSNCDLSQPPGSDTVQTLKQALGAHGVLFSGFSSASLRYYRVVIPDSGRTTAPLHCLIL